MFEHGTAELGQVDVLVNNAVPFLDESSDDTFDLNLDVHLHGSLNTCREVVDGMVESGYGKIINFTSIHTKNAVGMSPAYDVGKFSLLGLTESLGSNSGARASGSTPSRRARRTPG
jgi:3-oxoacyl-[acyl-carrier protein] reductase